MNDVKELVERLRDEAADTIEQQAAEIERLRRAVAEAACYLSPAGCKAMNDAYKASPKCNTCDGAGWVLGTDIEPGCCGNLTSGGECRGDCAIPVQVETQEPCPDCLGSSDKSQGGDA